MTTSTKKILIGLPIILVTLSIFYFFVDLIIILAISILISLMFEPLISFLEKQKLNRFTSTVIVYAVFGFLVYLGLSYIIPSVLVQTSSLIVYLQDFSLQQQISTLELEIMKYFPFLAPGIVAEKLELFVTLFFENTLLKITALLGNIFSIFALLVLIPFTTFFISKDADRIKKGMINLLPNKYFEMSYSVIRKVTDSLGSYVRGWLLAALFVGIACGIGFHLIGIDNAFALGVIAGFGALVPYLGPVIGGVPALIISIIQYGDLSALPFLVLLLTIVYSLDNGIVQPYVFSKCVDLHPLLIILLIVMGSQIYGVIGMLLAVPLATVLKTATQETYRAFKNYKIAKLQ